MTTTNGNRPTITDGRKALHAYVSDDAHESWHEAAAEHGVSVSAMLEALAVKVDELMVAEPYLARTCRKIDAERRRRKDARR